MRLTQTGQFKKDIERLQKRGKDLAKIKAVINLLLRKAPLPPRNRDHQLGGNWSGHRDCHIEPDWILIYKTLGDELRLERTGTHSDLF
jgi:mRNA interferase YafQ